MQVRPIIKTITRINKLKTIISEIKEIRLDSLIVKIRQLNKNNQQKYKV